MAWALLRENREAVAAKLRRGEYDGLVQTGMGRRIGLLDERLAFL